MSVITYGTQVPVTSEQLISTGNIALGTVAPVGWINSMTNVDGMGNHYSSFGYAVGDSSGVYAVGDDFYDGPIPYVAKFDTVGNLLWQKQITYDGNEGWSGQLNHALLLTSGYYAGNLLVAGVAYDFGDGHEGALLSTINPADGSNDAPVLFITNNLGLDVWAAQINHAANGNLYVLGSAQVSASPSNYGAWLYTQDAGFGNVSAVYADTTGYVNYFYGIATDMASNVYISGNWYNGVGNEDLVISTGSDLSLRWAASILPNAGYKNGAVMMDATGSNLFVTTFNGEFRVSKLDAATGNGIWTTSSGAPDGGSEGGFTTANGDVLVGGWASVHSGPEGMLFTRVNGVTGEVIWSNALYGPELAGGTYTWYDGSSSAFGPVGTDSFAAAGTQFLDGTEGAIALKLPLDGTGQGSYGPYTYVSYYLFASTTALTTTARSVDYAPLPVATNIVPAYTDTVRTNQFELDGGNGIAAVTLSFPGSSNLTAQYNYLGIDSNAEGAISMNSNGPQGYGRAFSQLMWANAEINSANIAYNGFQSNSYSVIYIDNTGFTIENAPGGNSQQTSNWHFDNSGNFNLPAQGNIVGGGNLRLQPSNGNSGAFLDIYLTTGPDIHIAGNAENLILGHDWGANVTVGINGDVTIQTDTGNAHVWTFDSTGNLTMPGDIYSASNISITAGNSPGETIVIGSVDTGGAGGAMRLIVNDVQEPTNPQLINVGATVYMYWGTNRNANVTAITHDVPNHNWYFTVDQTNIAGFVGGTFALFGPGQATWQFTTDGNFRLPSPGTIIGNVSTATASSAANSIGYLGMPQNSQNTDYTLAFSDQGGQVYMAASGNVTIPDNATVAFPVGATVALIAGPGSSVNVNITSDTLYLGWVGSTGTRMLGQYGMATVVKVAATTWYISGTGLS